MIEDFSIQAVIQITTFFILLLNKQAMAGVDLLRQSGGRFQMFNGSVHHKKKIVHTQMDLEGYKLYKSLGLTRDENN